MPSWRRPAKRDDAVPAPRVEVDPPFAEFGEVLEHRVQQQDFLIRNDGNALLVLNDIHLSCPICLSYEVDRKTIPPGQAALLTVRFDPRGYAGEVEQMVVLMTNDPRTPNLGLRLLADVSARFRLEGGPVYFEALQEGEVRTQRVLVIPYEPLTEPLEVRSVNPGTFSATVEPAPETGGYWVDVTTVPTNGIDGMMVGLIELGLPSETAPVYSFNVVSELMSDLRVFPRTLRFDPDWDDQLRLIFVRQTGRKPLARITGVDLPSDRLACQIHYDSGLSRIRLNVYATGLGDRIGYQGDIVIRTDDPERSAVRVPVTVARSKYATGELSRPSCYR